MTAGFGMRWSMEYNYIEKRYNVMGLSSIEAFASIKGGMNGNCKDVYFLRVTGVNTAFMKDVERMDEAQTGKMLLRQGIYNRVGAFPKNIGADAAAIYTGCYQKWVDSGRTKLYTGKAGEQSGMGELLGASCKKVLEVYHVCNPNVNASIEKNFVIKLLYWLDELAYEYLKNWNPKLSMKFVAQGITKEQEYFFCYLLTLLGIDVLLLQNEADIDERLEGLHLSRQITLGEKKAVALEAYDRQKCENKNNGSGRENGQATVEVSPGQRPRVTIPPMRRGSAGRNGGMGTGSAGNGNAAGSNGNGGWNTGANAGAGSSGSGGWNTGANAGAGSSGSSGWNTGANAGAGSSGSGGRNTGANVGNTRQGVNSGRNTGSGTAGGTTWNTGSGAAGNTGSGGREAGRISSSAAGRGGQELGFEELALRASSVVMIAIHDRKGDIIGSGSGIMIGRDGYILTNNHVARGGSFYSVRIENDDTMYKTDEIIKYNSLLDLAVIRIDRKLQPLPIYRGSRPLVRGQKVVAIGSPLGLFNSVSDGIIAGFRRVNDVDMIQFTAPISHGSSGGALLNMYGEVIGVSTAGFDEGQNINLAVGYEFINTFVRGFQ